MNYFLEHPEYNLIFAPHFNLFNKKATRRQSLFLIAQGCEIWVATCDRQIIICIMKERGFLTTAQRY